MATQFTSNTLSGLYDDDFNEADNYHHILFNNGRALQARELTQLQTIIFRELARLGKNIFKEGAVLSAGGFAVNADYEYVKISATNAGGAFASIPVGTVFKNPLTGVEARVLEVKPRDGTDFILDTLYVQYINSGADTIGATPTRFGDEEVLFDQSGGGYQLTTETPNATGKGVRFTVGEGDFFVLGHFVHAAEQSIVLSPHSQIANATVGFKVVQEVITVNDDNDLFDNANGIVNTASPGADRYRIRLELTTQDKIASDETFVFLATVENSKITEEIEESDAYNKIEEFVALRTKEESGNYVVNPFIVNLQDAVAGDSSLELIVSPGLAYINGYRVEKTSPTKLLVPRPQETETVTNDVIPVVYGNYFLADSNLSITALDASLSNLHDDFQGEGNIIGTSRIRAVEKDGNQQRVYVFDVKIDSDRSLHDVKSVKAPEPLVVFNLSQEAGKTKLYGTTDNDLLFPTSRPRPESFADITLTKQVFDGPHTADGSGIISLTTLPAGQSYTDTTLWIVSAFDEPAVAHTVSTPTNSGRDVQITGLTSGVIYNVYAYVQKTATRKSKTLTTATATLAKQIDSANNVTYYEFSVPDIYEVDSAKANSSSGINMLPSLRLDDGQRDNFYAKGRLILNAADSAPPNLYVNYQYFARGAGGDFYDATSYGNVPVAYKDIPNHVLKDGTIVNLRNYLDFRPDETNFGTSDIFGLPRNGTNITADVSYYLPRADKLLLTQEGEIQLLLGQQAGNPQYKPTPNHALEIYKILLNANTLDENDLRVTPIEHKHYTMADIAKIEAKLDDLEEYTTLSILELEQKLNPALDSDGIERAESGSQVDDFGDQTGADTKNGDYAASIDPESKLIRPMLDEDNIRLVIDNTLSSNVVKKGDNVYINYDSAEWAVQSLASRFVKINPFGLVDNVGTIKLSPTSDEWKESVQEAQKAVTGKRLDQKQAFLWNNWNWNWFGRSIEDVDLDTFGELQNQKNLTGLRKRDLVDFREQYASTYTVQKREGFNSSRYVSRVVPSDTLRETVGKRIVDLALIPWIRSRKIYFHAKGLKPNTKFTPFFDGEKVTQWCRQEVSFVQFSDRADDNGNQRTHQAITGHPSGFSELISDENGEIVGSFFVPNIAPEFYLSKVNQKARVKTQGQRFRSGIREFKLLDIDTNDWAAAGSKAFAYYAAKGSVWNQLTSTRPNEYNWPIPYWANFPQAYSAKELQDYANQVREANVKLVDPKLAGKYGPGAAGLSVAALRGLDNTGQMSQVLSDYIDVDQNQFASNIVSTMTAPQNPMAQTFYVDNQFGVVLTSVQLYFRTKDTGNLPVSIHLRPVVNGRPSNHEIVPDSHVYLNPGDVTAIGLNPTLSVIQESPTTFTFDEPVYLSPWTHYAIVVSSQSTEYELFSAKTQEPVYGSTSKIVSTQPAPGSLFLPQNGMFWVETKDQDLMYKLKRATFETGGASLILKNANLPAKLLKENPLQTTSGTKSIVVRQMCHGLEVGDLAFIDSADDVGGVSASTYINGSHTVTAADIHGFAFSYDSDGGSAPNATSTSIGGGSRVLSRRNAIFNVVNPYIESIIPNNTSIDVSAKFTEGKNISSTRISAAERWTQDEEYSRITPKQNVEFATPKAVYNVAAETLNLGSGVASAYVKVDLKTANDYVSPIIDLQRASLVMVGYCLDNPDVTPHINPVNETQPYGGTTGSKHITTPVFLEQAAVGIEARALLNIPDASAIEMYYRTATSDENIYEKYWTRQPAVDDIPYDNSARYRDAQWLAGGKGGNLKPFNQVQVKFVMKGADAAPSMRNLRLRYLAV